MVLTNQPSGRCGLILFSYFFRIKIAQPVMAGTGESRFTIQREYRKHIHMSGISPENYSEIQGRHRGA